MRRRDAGGVMPAGSVGRFPDGVGVRPYRGYVGEVQLPGAEALDVDGYEHTGAVAIQPRPVVRAYVEVECRRDAPCALDDTLECELPIHEQRQL